MTDQCIADGGIFIHPAAVEDVFTPEEISIEQKMLGQAAEEYIAGEVVPCIDEIESGDHPALQRLFKNSAQLGLQGVDIPEAFGGMGLDGVSALILTEKSAVGGPFGIASLDHGTFGTLPILYFGTGEQKAEYLPAMAGGQKIGAFALTESDAGSDALAARTVATPDETGEFYVLNGEKQFITNAAYADVFITFARLEGQGLSAFIVDRDSPGLSVGEEEGKLGIKGSSTRSLVLENVQVPSRNLLHQAGQGHVVAFNTLNVGRFRLGGLCLGGAKQSIRDAVSYAKTRVQFGRALTEFGLIQKKIGQMFVDIFAAESMLYRSAGLFDSELAGIDFGTGSPDSQWTSRLSKLSIEGAVNKVFASLMLDFVTDQTLQIYGGYGYTKHYPVERYYRDSRINRIFAGTNDINRLLIADMLRKNYQALGWSPQEFFEGSDTESTAAGNENGGESVDPSLSDIQIMLQKAKQALLLGLQAADPEFPQSLSCQQEVRAMISDTLIEIYAMESCLLRARKNGGTMPETVCRLYAFEALGRIHRQTTSICAAVLEGERLAAACSRLDTLLRAAAVNTVALRRTLAEYAIKRGRYMTS